MGSSATCTRLRRARVPGHGRDQEHAEPLREVVHQIHALREEVQELRAELREIRELVESLRQRD